MSADLHSWKDKRWTFIRQMYRICIKRFTYRNKIINFLCKWEIYMKASLLRREFKAQHALYMFSYLQQDMPYVAAHEHKTHSRHKKIRICKIVMSSLYRGDNYSWLSRWMQVLKSMLIKNRKDISSLVTFWIFSVPKCWAVRKQPCAHTTPEPSTKYANNVFLSRHINYLIVNHHIMIA